MKNWSRIIFYNINFLCNLGDLISLDLQLDLLLKYLMLKTTKEAFNTKIRWKKL